MSCRAAGLSGSRTRARIGLPRVSEARAAAPPCWPAAPITSSGRGWLAMVARLAAMLVAILVLIELHMFQFRLVDQPRLLMVIQTPASQADRARVAFLLAPP